jgi:hypothetical protein
VDSRAATAKKSLPITTAPKKSRRLAMRSYSLSFQPSTAAAAGSPPIARWTPTSLETVPMAAGSCVSSDTLSKVKNTTAGALPTAVNKSPADERSKRTAKGKKAAAVVSSSPRRLLQRASTEPVVAVGSGSSSSAESEIERFEREFLQPLQQQQQQQQLQQKQQLQTADAIVHHRDLRYMFVHFSLPSIATVER